MGRDFPPVQTGPGAHPASCKMGTGSFPGLKCGVRRAADRSPSSRAAVMEKYSFTSTHRLGHTGPVRGTLYIYISCLYCVLFFNLCLGCKKLKFLILSCYMHSCVVLDVSRSKYLPGCFKYCIIIPEHSA